VLWAHDSSGLNPNDLKLVTATFAFGSTPQADGTLASSPAGSAASRRRDHLRLAAGSTHLEWMLPRACREGGKKCCRRESPQPRFDAQ
jgi:hypothetical protein